MSRAGSRRRRQLAPGSAATGRALGRTLALKLAADASNITQAETPTQRETGVRASHLWHIVAAVDIVEHGGELRRAGGGEVVGDLVGTEQRAEVGAAEVVQRHDRHRRQQAAVAGAEEQQRRHQ